MACRRSSWLARPRTWSTAVPCTTTAPVSTEWRSTATRAPAVRPRPGVDLHLADVAWGSRMAPGRCRRVWPLHIECLAFPWGTAGRTGRGIPGWASSVPASGRAVSIAPARRFVPGHAQEAGARCASFRPLLPAHVFGLFCCPERAGRQPGTGLSPGPPTVITNSSDSILPSLAQMAPRRHSP